MKKRQGENAQAWFRSNRFYNVKGNWYFSTREGVDFGPFDNQQEASDALKHYIQRSSGLTQHSFA